MKTLSKSTLVVLFVALASPASADHKMAEHMMEKCDKDKDGKISEMEFMDSKKEYFKEADENSDGFLDSSEVKEMVKEKHDKMKKAKKHGHSDKHD